ncbi:MAG: hypothetical protein JXO51_05825 [Candidatus Aminicenantes bacterium]|nr:hypothetical protein [Candidatus Aminicenantes bacterium]
MNKAFIALVVLISQSVLLAQTPERACMEGPRQELPGIAGNWAGHWTRVGSTFQDHSKLVISDVSAKSFKFELNVQSGGHVDEFSGTASVTGNRAVFQDADRDCTLIFVLEDKTLALKTEGDCLLAMGCTIEGAYRPDVASDEPTLWQRGVFESEAQEDTFLQLVGEEASMFEFSMQLIAEEEDLDGFSARVRTGFVRGLAATMTAIVMIHPEGKIWAAVRDNDEVRYFTNDPPCLRKLPKTIERWRQQFPELKIVFVSAGAGDGPDDRP